MNWKDSDPVCLPCINNVRSENPNRLSSGQGGYGTTTTM